MTGTEAAFAPSSGAFSGARWRITSALTGDYALADFVLQPSASVLVAFESHDAWVDNGGAAIHGHAPRRAGNEVRPQ